MLPSLKFRQLDIDGANGEILQKDSISLGTESYKVWERVARRS
jgi:hypothetical protein